MFFMYSKYKNTLFKTNGICINIHEPENRKIFSIYPTHLKVKMNTISISWKLHCAISITFGKNKLHLV